MSGEKYGEIFRGLKGVKGVQVSSNIEVCQIRHMNRQKSIRLAYKEWGHRASAVPPEIPSRKRGVVFGTPISIRPIPRNHGAAFIPSVEVGTHGSGEAPLTPRLMVARHPGDTFLAALQAVVGLTIGLG